MSNHFLVPVTSVREMHGEKYTMSDTCKLYCSLAATGPSNQRTWLTYYCSRWPPEPSCSTSDRVAGRVIRDWMCRVHQKYWQSIPRQRHAKTFPCKLSAKRTAEFLKLNISRARQVTGLLTRHHHWFDSPT
jgi:hypothetical protein